jgi:hypothetical protein
MFDDPIVAEIRKIRHAHAEKFNNDIDAIVSDIQRRERESGRTYVNYPPRKVEQPSNSQHTEPATPPANAR